MRTSLEGGIVILYIDTTEGLPSHQMLWKFERAVFDEFTIESTIGGIVDILKEDTIHGRLNRCSESLCIDIDE